VLTETVSCAGFGGSFILRLGPSGGGVVGPLPQVPILPPSGYCVWPILSPFGYYVGPVRVAVECRILCL
jgi:hypothetical protein